MDITRKPIGKHLLLILGGLAVLIVLSDLSVFSRLFPGEPQLVVRGKIDPSLSVTFSSSYLAGKDGIGCENWSLFAGWGRRYSAEARVAEVFDGNYEVSIPVPDRSAERCGYTLQGVFFGLAPKGKTPSNWVALFNYSDAMSATEFAIANPLDAHCIPINDARDQWICSRSTDAPVVLGYRTDRMPSAMTMNIHVQTKPPYDLVY
ncbi:hypothetical protein R50072_13720 [Simiduia litorea]|uniref:hypothetical protein n=1 Tax=Simiduia litorea TaxID=1435348 RepID=UPI0036F39ADE